MGDSVSYLLKPRLLPFIILARAVFFGATTAVPGAELVAFALHQCVPNPFNPMTTILNSVPAQTKVSLRIYSVFGRGVTAGTYFCRLEAGKRAETKTMVLLK